MQIMYPVYVMFDNTPFFCFRYRILTISAHQLMTASYPKCLWTQTSRLALQGKLLQRSRKDLKNLAERNCWRSQNQVWTLSTPISIKQNNSLTQLCCTLLWLSKHRIFIFPLKQTQAWGGFSSSHTGHMTVNSRKLHKELKKVNSTLDRD